jgi:hypothetical protein
VSGGAQRSVSLVSVAANIHIHVNVTNFILDCPASAGGDIPNTGPDLLRRTAGIPRSLFDALLVVIHTDVIVSGIAVYVAAG